MLGSWPPPPVDGATTDVFPALTLPPAGAFVGGISRRPAPRRPEIPPCPRGGAGPGVLSAW
ncbi:hypothetical protein GCM10010243_28740 [Streptomyces matensis]|nr:hypothetical protein GCM10010243_28740 [Streptomyces matensis]